MADFEILINDGDLERRLGRFSFMLSDLRSFWPLVIPLFIGWMRRQFETDGGFAGTPWAPLSPAYGIWKEQHYPGKGLLVREGALRRAVSEPERHSTPTSLILTVTDPKIGYHQGGTATMPARPILFSVLPAQAQAELDEAADRYVADLLGRF